MKLHLVGLPVLLVCWTVGAGAVVAQDAPCSSVHVLARMASTRSLLELRKLKTLSGDGYRARLIFAFRAFEIDQTGVDSASRVVALIPQNEDQNATWHTLNGMLCDHETVEEMKSLGKLQDHLPRDLAKAVDIAPDRMYDFVSYAYDSIQDPHSDYAVQMQVVCRSHHGMFLNAVNRMPENDRTWFTTKIFDPTGCRAIALPEAD
jgi:hypothetical protein